MLVRMDVNKVVRLPWQRAEKGSAGVYPLIDRDLGEQPGVPLAVKKRCGLACDV